MSKMIAAFCLKQNPLWRNVEIQTIPIFSSPFHSSIGTIYESITTAAIKSS